jgi:hypothetical protein
MTDRYWQSLSSKPHFSAKNEMLENLFADWLFENRKPSFIALWQR